MFYGFAQCYAATGRADFLATSERAADHYLAHLPADRVPYWDFSAPVTATTPRDTSAAAVAANHGRRPASWKAVSIVALSVMADAIFVATRAATSSSGTCTHPGGTASECPNGSEW